MNKQYKTIFDIPEGFFLNPEKCFFSVILPEDGTNLVRNPELKPYVMPFFTEWIFQSDTGVVGGAGENYDVHYGFASLDVIGINGDRIYRPINENLLIETSYTYSVSLKGNGIVKIYFLNEALDTIIGGSKEIELSPYWTRYSITINNLPPLYGGSDPTAVENPNVAVECVGDCHFLASAFQVENKPYMTTFISGEMESILGNENDYVWFGVPHKSIAARNKNVPDGGRIMNLKDLGFNLTGFIGLGLSPLEYNTSQLANGYGSVVNGKSLAQREFTITGQILAKSQAEYFKKRQNLVNIFENDIVAFRFQMFDCDKPISEEYEFTARYVSGLEGNYTNLYQENVAITFVMHDPFIYRTGNGATHFLTDKVINQAFVFGRNSKGEWSNVLDDEPVGFYTVNQMKILSDKKLYIAMNPAFVQFNGTSYDPKLYASGTAIYGSTGFLAFDEDKQGNIYLGGDFDEIEHGLDPVVNRQSIGKYNYLTDTVTAIGFTDGAVHAVKCLPNGKVIFAGAFSEVTSESLAVTVVDNIVMYNPFTNEFETLTGLSAIPSINIVFCLEVSGNTLYIGGTGLFRMYNLITQTEYTNVPILGNRSPSATNVGTAYVETIAVNKNGEVYIGGLFDAFNYSTPISGLPDIFSVAKVVFNGVNNIGLEPIGLIASVPPLTNSGAVDDLGGVGFVRDMKFNEQNELIIVGEFNHINNDPGVFGTGIVPEIGDPIDLCRDGSYVENCFGVCKYTPEKKLELLDITPIGETSTGFNAVAVAFEDKNSKQFINFGNNNNYISNYPGLPGGLYFGLVSSYRFPNVSEAVGDDGAYVFVPNNIVINLTSNIKTYPKFYIESYHPSKLISLNTLTIPASINFKDKYLIALQQETLTVIPNDMFQPVKSNYPDDQLQYIDIGTSFLNFYLVKNDNYITAVTKALTEEESATTHIYMKWKFIYNSIDSIFGV